MAAREGALRVTRASWVRAALIGLLLPRERPPLRLRANGPDGSRVADHRLGPLLVVLLRLAGGDRPPTLAIAGVLVGRRSRPLPSGGRPRTGGDRADRPVRARMGDRLVPLSAAPLPRRLRQRLRDARGRADPAPVRRRAAADLGAISGTSLLAFAYLVLVGSLVGFTAYVWLLHHAPLGTVSTYAYVNPVVAIALGVLFLDEQVTWRVLLGAAIVLASVAVVLAAGVRSRRRAVLRVAATRPSRRRPARGTPRSRRPVGGARRRRSVPRRRSPWSCR